MAEYITKQSVLELQADYGEGQNTMMLVDPKLVKKLPTADVVERERIDKVIEMIKQEIQNGTIKIMSGNEKLFDILKDI